MTYLGFRIDIGRGMLIGPGINTLNGEGYIKGDFTGYCRELNDFKIKASSKEEAIIKVKDEIDRFLTFKKCKNKEEYDKSIYPKNKSIFTVAECRGGLMEDPDFHYHNHQNIKAYTEEEALEIYNKTNNCYYFYGSVLSKKAINESSYENK